VPRSLGRVRRCPTRRAALPALIFCLAFVLEAVACTSDDEPVGPDPEPGPSCFPAAQTVSVTAGVTTDGGFKLICRPVLYMQQVGSAYEIFSIRADGSGQTNITNDGGSNSNPTWSPDASRITYTAGSELAVMNANGTGRVTLTSPADAFQESEPAWSPDGFRIALVRYEAPFFQTDIWLINADGTGLTQLTTTASFFELHPTWSPDGSMIAFQRGGDIWKRNLGTGVETKLTTNPFVDGYPTWSPDGSKIAFAATDRADDGEGNNFYELFTMNPDGTGLTRITNDEFFDLQPAWSPDGSTLVYTTFRFGTWDLFTVEVEGGTPERLTPVSQSNESAPTW
jgi:Tol biopolymer transport system component